jgi:hypothetical protein
LNIVDQTLPILFQMTTEWKEGDWLLSQQILVRFFQDKKIKVSLFLQHKMQLQSGIIVLPKTTILPPEIEHPGIIR